MIISSYLSIFNEQSSEDYKNCCEIGSNLAFSTSCEQKENLLQEISWVEKANK